MVAPFAREEAQHRLPRTAESDLPAGVHKMIAEARCYAEGTAVRIEVHDAPDLAVVKMLARIKNEN